MKSPIQFKQTVLLAFVLLVSAFMTALNSAFAQPADSAAGQAAPPPAESASDYVNITVDGGTIQQVLNTFALQTGRNVVVGPEVICEGVNIHLNHVRWDEALEVILKPYGFGYRNVGDTIVISKLEKLAELATVEPLETKVFELRFLDASDVQGMLTNQLSARGTISVMTVRGQKGWEFASRSENRSGRGGAYGNLGKLERATGKANVNDQGKSKTLIVTDVPSSLARIAAMLARLDTIPQQVLVEARFMEVNNNLLKDLGLDITFSQAEYSIGQILSTVAPGNFDPANAGFWPNTLTPLNQNAFFTRNGGALDVALRMIQEDKDTKVLSAPRVLTLNNQEATIIVGQKFPIIESNVSGGTGNNNTSTTLDYYENIGIQLNVVPQICDDGHINMIVHPSVSTIVSFESGKVNTGASTNATALTEYPVIDTREAETQILLKNKETAIIGGLLQDRKGTTVSKVPFLGDIPLLGRLFRRDITDNRTINLLIFLSATIVDEKNYDVIVAKEGEATMEGVKPAAVEAESGEDK
ncbi:MAG: hypothetical protein WC334_05930 [Kiritimatiellales bacterium]|jgi:type IV pilus assembly protein PilQ